ncbi:MAG: hypothetical protein CMO01_29740 [Thalassobius sp.]|nr:hypothetical protein [Thalassovita sp.]
MNKRMIKFLRLQLLVSFLFLSFISSAQQAKNENKWEKDIAKFEKKDAENPPQLGEILFIGSSSITIWRDIQEYFPDKPIINRGFGGSQTSDLLTFKERLILPYKPSQVVIYVGENDIAANKTPKKAAKDGKKLIKWILKQLPEATVAYISLKPSISRWELRDNMQAANVLMKQFASKNDKVEFIDVWDSMLGDEGKPLANIFLEDGLHMNANGYVIWQKKIAPYLK